MAKDIVIKVSIDTSFVENHSTRTLFAAFSGKIFNDVIINVAVDKTDCKLLVE